MVNYNLIFTKKFKKDFKKFQHNTKTLNKITTVFDFMILDGVNGIPKQMRPHKLIGQYKNYWECHILSDLLLVWEQDDLKKEIVLIRIGTHSDLFK